MKHLQNQKSLPKTEEQNQAMKTYRENKLKLWLKNKLQTKDMLCRRNTHCRLEGSAAVETVDQEASNEAHGRRQHTGTRQGKHRLFQHMRNQGEQVETLWESGKTIRHLTQEEGQGT